MNGREADTDQDEEMAQVLTKDANKKPRGQQLFEFLDEEDKWTDAMVQTRYQMSADMSKEVEDEDMRRPAV